MEDDEAQASAEAFEHQVGGVGAVGGAGRDEQRGEETGRGAAARQGAAGGQEAEDDRAHPGGHVGEHGQPVIETAGQQHDCRQQAVQGRPDGGLVEVVEEANHVALLQVGRQPEPIKVVGIAVVGGVVPQVAMDSQEMAVEPCRQRHRRGEHEGRPGESAGRGVVSRRTAHRTSCPDPGDEAGGDGSPPAKGRSSGGQRAVGCRHNPTFPLEPKKTAGTVCVLFGASRSARPGGSAPEGMLEWGSQRDGSVRITFRPRPKKVDQWPSDSRDCG